MPSVATTVTREGKRANIPRILRVPGTASCEQSRRGRAGRPPDTARSHRKGRRIAFIPRIRRGAPDAQRLIRPVQRPNRTRHPARPPHDLAARGTPGRRCRRHAPVQHQGAARGVPAESRRAGGRRGRRPRARILRRREHWQGGDPVPTRPRRAPGLHGRAGHRGPRCDAKRHGPDDLGSRATRRSASTRLFPCDLVIDHSVQVDAFNSGMALSGSTVEKEFERNNERYQFLKWGQRSFDNFRVVPLRPPGIVHQVNLEYLAQVAFDDGTAGSIRTASSAPTRTRP